VIRSAWSWVTLTFTWGAKSPKRCTTLCRSLRRSGSLIGRTWCVTSICIPQQRDCWLWNESMAIAWLCLIWMDKSLRGKNVQGNWLIMELALMPLQSMKAKRQRHAFPVKKQILSDLQLLLKAVSHLCQLKRKYSRVMKMMAKWEETQKRERH